MELFDQKIIGQSIRNVEELLKAKNFKTMEVESFDSVDNYFNESNWMIFQVEYNEVIRFELGAVFNEKKMSSTGSLKDDLLVYPDEVEGYI